MSTFTRLSASGVVLAVFLVAIVSLAAEESTVASAQPPQTIPMGTYERFTVLQKLRFGATALVNPTVAENAAVVYSFEPDEVLAEAERHQEVSDQISAGRVQFGRVVEAGAKTMLKVDQKSTIDMVGTMRHAADVRYVSKGGKFLSMRPTLGGARPSGEWIAWRPEEGKSQ